MVIDTNASFTPGGDELIGSEVTAALGIEPSFTFDKGTEIPSRTGPLVQPTGVWSIGSEGALEFAVLEEHLTHLLDRLEPQRATIRALMERRALTARFFCLFAGEGQSGFAIAPAVRLRMGELGASLDLDIYFPLEDEEESA